MTPSQHDAGKTTSRDASEQQPGYYYKPYTIVFPDGDRAVAIRAPAQGDAMPIVEALGLQSCRSALLISGGAALMDPYDAEQLRELMTNGVARYAEAHHVAVIDGGTAAGVMRLLGEIRHQWGYHFPLVGVAPIGAVSYPGHEMPDVERLDSGHSHFVLTDGDHFGQESDAMTRITRAIAERGSRRGLNLIVNGGEVARQETYDRTMEDEGACPLLVLEGSGRFADDVAAAAGGASTDDARVAEILRRGEVKIVSMDKGPEHLYAQLAMYLA